MLIFNSLGAATFTDFFFLIADLGNQVGHEAHVGFKARGRRVHLGRQEAGRGGGLGDLVTVGHGSQTQTNYGIPVEHGGANFDQVNRGSWTHSG